jgi:hypothetical protein
MCLSMVDILWVLCLVVLTTACLGSLVFLIAWCRLMGREW